MKCMSRGLAGLLTLAALLPGASAFAQDKTVLTTDREKASYMVGSDIGRSIEVVGPDLDLATFEKAVRNAFAGGKPPLAEEEARATGQALMTRIGARRGQATADGKLPDVAKDKVGLLLGTDVGRSLAPIKDEIEFPIFLQAIRTVLAKGKPLLDEQEALAIRKSFSEKVQAKMQAKAAAEPSYRT